MSAASDEPIPAASPLKKASPGMPWGQPETFHLIDAYEEQCLTLKRRQLKAQEWEVVAATVAARSGTGGLAQIPAKSGTQCRHKIEKLRKRLKAESARPVRSFWPFFDRLTRLERGPVPLAACPPTDRITRSSDEDDQDDDGEDDVAVSKIKTTNGGIQSKVNRDNGEENEGEPAGRAASASRSGELSMVEVLQGFGEQIVKMEKRRMEIMQELERDRMEMEMKREKMIMEAQTYLLENITVALNGEAHKKKKVKKSQHLF